jgi:2-oxoglutarate/2-oxoacid ferredoxin oxidoreductase subunit beta
MIMAKPDEALKTNHLGLLLRDYKGGESTLCAGCGHDAITSQIIRAFFEYGVDPRRVIKLSGIGCASKTPTYFLNRSFGFNAIHGRMPSIAAGALLANRHLIAIGVSGDGDTASIGIGQFVHAMRRNIPMIYIMENNGVYGLTKGQFSATAEKGSRLRTGVVNDLPAIDCCILAIELGCGYVARSFAGDPKQLVSLIKGALGCKGMAFLDVLSPCVAFNNHEGSTKSYNYLMDNEELLHEIGFVPAYNQISADYPEGSVKVIELHDKSHLTLRKLGKEYDPADKPQALQRIREANDRGEVLTGLYYIGTHTPDFTETLNLADEPLATLAPDRVRPSREALRAIMNDLK